MFDDVNQDNFSPFLKKNENVIAFFSATWCGPCKMQIPILEQILQTFPNKIKVAHINVDQNSNLARAYRITGTPSLIFFKKGNLVRFKSRAGGRADKLVGLQDFDRLQGVVQYVINMKIISK